MYVHFTSLVEQICLRELLGSDDSKLTRLKIDSAPFSKPDDWVNHSRVTRINFKKCHIEGRVSYSRIHVA
jgi:hypothetical protein